MAKPNSSAEATLATTDSPLVQAQTEAYVSNQKRGDFYKNMSSYMFWGATSILGALAFGITTGGVGPLLLIGGGVASVLTFIGSVAFSSKATEISERGNVFYSNIDSSKQAHHMVQAFAKAQSQEAAPDQSTPMAGPSWAERSGGSVARSGSWQNRVAAQADREEALAMQNLRS